MKIVCIDDEKIILESIVAKCRKIPFVEEVNGFVKVSEARKFIEENEIDVVLSDIDMPECTGIELAEKLKENNPNLTIIFLTSYSEYAVDAFKLHANGYLLKPVSSEQLLEELTYVKNRAATVPENVQRIYAKTFGNFDLFVDGKPVNFAWKKSKEALAYLIDRQGVVISRKELAGILFEDSIYSRSTQSYMTKLFSELYKSLAEVHADKIFLKEKNCYRVDVNAMSCDSWDYLAKKEGFENAFHGEYMLQYSWAELCIVKFTGL